MRIVVLDGYTLNPGDLSWAKLESLGDCVVHDRTAPEETVSRSQGADIILTNKTVLDRRVLADLPDLKYIGVLATGYNVVDIDATAKRGIPVTNVPEYGTASVAQMVFAHVLNFCNRVGEHSTSVRAGNWSRSRDFCFWEHPLHELDGMTLGIIGLGRIGSAVARLALAFGMRVLAHNPTHPVRRHDGIVMTDLESIFRDSDIVSLHCPLTSKNERFVNAELLNLMKPTAFLVNTSRGLLVDEAALASALNQGHIAGAGLDVLAREPPSPDNPLVSARNCYLTPHIAWATYGARRRLMDIAINNVKAFLGGTPVNIVNGVQCPGKNPD